MARLSMLIATASLVALAACAPKPAQLPPPPGPPAGAGSGQGEYQGPDQDANGPLAAQFRREVTSDTVNFALDSYDIDGEARAILDSQAQWLASRPNVRITIEGHCDERGTREYNLALGDRRANAAKNYLAARGINPARITTISYGKERPLATGSDEDSWARNRRAVTVVIG